MNPLVSVVIPSYNAAKFLGTTIKSVLSQTFTNFEILIINDGSTDETAKIAIDYGLLDHRIRLINQNNAGVATARNLGIKLAQGEYVAFLDADDIWQANKLAFHVEHLQQNPKLGLSFGKVEFVTPSGRSTHQYSRFPLENIQPEQLYYENLIVTTSNAVIPRQVFTEIGGFDPQLNGMEDAEMFLRITCNGWEIQGIDKVLVQYRNNSNGLSSHLQHLETVWENMNQKIQTYAPQLITSHYPTAKAYFLRYLARRALRLKNSSAIAIQFINRALQSNWQLLYQQPRRTWATLLISYIYAIAFWGMGRSQQKAC